jgi:hypothetical protein
MTFPILRGICEPFHQQDGMPVAAVTGGELRWSEMGRDHSGNFVR